MSITYRTPSWQSAASNPVRRLGSPADGLRRPKCRNQQRLRLYRSLQNPHRYEFDHPGSESEVIETTVGKVAAELAKRGLDPEDRITITIEPDELIPGRRASRARVVAAGLTDDDIDRLIKQAQKEVEPRAG